MDDVDVRWVASQSPIPALQALIREAERDKKSTWLPPDPTAYRTTPLAASTSSASQPPHVPARLSRSVAPSSSRTMSQEDEPEAAAFVELLRDAFKKLDENSLKKQRLAARAREKAREPSLARGSIDSRATTSSLKARPLAKTSSASAICPPRPSTSAPQLASSTSTSSFEFESRGRALAKTASLGPAVDIPSVQSTPATLPSYTQNSDPKLPSRLPTRASTIPSALATTRKPNTQESTFDSPMQDVIDLTETDTEWESPIYPPTIRADTTMIMHVDGSDDSDEAMDMSFFQPEPPPPSLASAPKTKLQPPQSNTVSRLPVQTQRARAGPPPLGMRRAPNFQPSQQGPSQGTKGVTIPRFKPPLLTNTGGTANKNASGTKPATTTSVKPPRGVATKGAAPKAAQESRDADSSFDVSFDMDIDALEEAMKAYD